MTYPRIVSIPETCDCTLTRADVIALTPDALEAQGYMELNREALIARMTESRAVGVVPNTLYDLMMSRISQVDKGQMAKRTVGKDSLIAPFKYRKRTRNAIAAYFSVTAGAANAHAGTTFGGVVYPASSWSLTITMGGGQWRSSITDIARYFLPGNTIVIEHLGVANVAYATQHKIIASVDVGVSPATVATVTVSAPYTDAQWALLPAPDKLPYQPTTGVLQLLSNNVSDWESWCYNQPVNNTRELLIDWFQTSRFTRCRNKVYEDMLGRIMDGDVNQYLKEFRFLPAAERNRLERQEYDRQWMNSVWYNDRLANQAVDPTWADVQRLEQVVDPEDATCVYEYKANALGIRTQLKENGRVIDYQGATLNLDAIFELCYILRRNRKLDGRSHEVIDFLADRITATNMEKVLIAYLKAEYGYDITRNIEQGKVIDSTGIVTFQYKIFDIPKHQFRIAIFSHEFFDDKIEAFATGSKHRGRMLVALDWNDIAIGILETNRQQREYKGDATANASSTWSCVMKMNTKTYDLESTTWDLEIGDYARHLIIENFGDACPYVDAAPCTVS